MDRLDKGRETLAAVDGMPSLARTQICVCFRWCRREAAPVGMDVDADVRVSDGIPRDEADRREPVGGLNMRV